ncbi:MAG: multicopper oxidase domain-containing protein [Flavobacteriales bacterium]|nr:multicopper oxidase domain-containing protein [Flavobacteriales bacterium]
MKYSILFFLVSYMGLSGWAQADTSFNIWMWTTGKHYLHDGQTLKNYGFTLGIGTPTIPGPVLRVKQGQKVQLDVRNQSQGAPHTIHLHGLDADQNNDGVPLTSWDIKHKETKAYEFVAEHPGTYLYHCHVASVIHVQLGMYGSIIVEPTANEAAPGYFYGRDFNLLISEADKSWFDNKPIHSTGDSVHALFSIPAYEPDYFFVNGQGQQQIDSLIMRPDENVFLRLSNVGYFENLVKFPSSLSVRLISSDGRPLPNKTIIDSLYIGAGERYGVMLSPIGKSTGSIEIQYLHMFTGNRVQSEFVPYGWDESLGIETTSIYDGFQVYPNPVIDKVHISYKTDGPYQVNIIDLAGKILNSDFSIEKNEIIMDLSSHKPGVYSLQIMQNDKVVYTNSIIKM